MALITLRQLLDHAAERDYGVPAFNVNDLEQMRAIMEAAHASAWRRPARCASSWPGTRKNSTRANGLPSRPKP